MGETGRFHVPPCSCTMESRSKKGTCTRLMYTVCSHTHTHIQTWCLGSLLAQTRTLFSIQEMFLWDKHILFRTARTQISTPIPLIIIANMGAQNEQIRWCLLKLRGRHVVTLRFLSWRLHVMADLRNDKPSHMWYCCFRLPTLGAMKCYEMENISIDMNHLPLGPMNFEKDCL